MVCDNIGLVFVSDLRDDNSRCAACCKSCGHVQLTPLPTILEDEEYYQSNMMSRALIQKSGMSEKQWMSELEKASSLQVKIVMENTKKSSSILEIGSGFGWVVKKLRENGFNAEGIELCDMRCTMAQEHLGVELYNFNVLNTDPPESLMGRFDTVLMFEVFEHIVNPIELIKRAAAFLKKNSTLIIEVPNYNYFLARHSTGYNKHRINRAHVSYFTPDTLVSVLNIAGVRDVNVYGSQKYSIENAIHWMRNNEPFLDYPQLDMPEGLEFANELFKEKVEKELTSDMLIAIGVMN